MKTAKNGKGHVYLLKNVEDDKAVQTVKFLKKEKEDPSDKKSTKLKIVHDGTTNEEVIEMLIDRLKYLNSKVPSRETSLAITKQEEALFWLEKRNKDREKRGVRGSTAK